MRVLILGVTGMLGSAVFQVFSQAGEHEVYGTCRSWNIDHHFSNDLAKNIVCGIDIQDFDSLVKAFSTVRPNLVINCVGLVKQLSAADDPLQAIPINALLPHRLAALCKATDSRLVHFSTDCVFSGAKGKYIEADVPDAKDLYGHSKLLGEVTYPHTVTLRTSIIGQELSGCRSLVGWFLAQEDQVKGYTKAIFSGLPTVELARVVHDYVLPQTNLTGLYHVSSEPISKHELLKKVARVFNKQIKIISDDSFSIDRSLDSTKFTLQTGYKSPDWDLLISQMHHAWKKY